MTSERTRLYRDKQNGKLMGVCAGIADYTGINVGWVRLAMVLSPQRTAREIRARFRDVDRRLAEVETYYVTSNPRLSAEIERLR